MGATMTVEEIATATDTEVAATVVVVMVVAADMEVDMTTGKKSCVLPMPTLEITVASFGSQILSRRSGGYNSRGGGGGGQNDDDYSGDRYNY